MPTTTIRRLVVDVPADVYDAFKMECLKNHVTLKDEIYKFLCAALDGAQIPPISSEKAVVVEDIDEPTKLDLDGKMKAKIDAELAPIREKLDGLEPSDVSAIREDVDGLKAALAAPQVCPKLEDLNQKFNVLANFIENNIYFQMKQQGANPCASDIEGLALLRSEEVPSTKGLDRGQLKELFIKGMKTKAF